VAPFDADGSLCTAGTTVKLTTVGAPAPHAIETTVMRADAPEVLEYKWGGFDMRWELEAFGGGTRPVPKVCAHIVHCVVDIQPSNG